MIRGYFQQQAHRRRPFVDAVFQFPQHQITIPMRLLVDTGADHTVISPADALHLEMDFGLDLATLPKATSTGVGGTADTRTIEAVLTLDTFSTPLSLTILEPPSGPLSPIPSLLDRDILSRFALFIDQRTDRVLLLEPGEADSLDLP